MASYYFEYPHCWIHLRTGGIHTRGSDCHPVRSFSPGGFIGFMDVERRGVEARVIQSLKFEVRSCGPYKLVFWNKISAEPGSKNLDFILKALYGRLSPFETETLNFKLQTLNYSFIFRNGIW